MGAAASSNGRGSRREPEQSKPAQRGAGPDMLSFDGQQPYAVSAGVQLGPNSGGSYADAAQGGDGALADLGAQEAAPPLVSGDYESDSDVEFDRLCVPIARPPRPDIVPTETAREDLRHPVVEGSMPDGWADYHSTDTPPNQLELEFVYGYRAHDCRSNLHYTASGEVAYHVATLCVVYDPLTHSQRFYAGHTAEVSCLAVHADGVHCASGQAEVGGSREPAPIFVWSALSLETAMVLPAAHEGGVAAVAFAQRTADASANPPGGGGGLDAESVACSVGHDEFHTLIVWDWRRGVRLAQARAHTAAIFALAVAADERGELAIATAGARSLKFWSMDGGTLRSKKGGFGAAHAHITGQLGALRDSPTFTALAHLRDGSGRLLSATARGELLLWRGNELCHYVKASTAPIFAIVAWPGGVATGGRDGRVSLWPAEWPATLEASLPPLRVYELREMVRGFADTAGRPRSLAGSATPCVRALACAGERLLVGTRGSEIFELAFEQGLDLPTLTMLAQGHAAPRPPPVAEHASARRPSEAVGGACILAQLAGADALLVSAGADKTLRVWSAERKCMVGMRLISCEAAAIAAAPDGSALALALLDSSSTVAILAVESLTDELVISREGPSRVGALGFSPNGAWLAVGTAAGTVELYAALDGCRAHGVCVALDGCIVSLDWSADSATLMANSDQYELGFWDARTCEQLPASATRGTSWATATCALSWASRGVFARFEQPQLVSCVCRSTDARALALGDEFGGVSLFAYPAASFVAGTVSYLAHGGRVGAIAWTATDTALLTAGAVDGCVMQWRHAIAGGNMAGDSGSARADGAGGVARRAQLRLEDVDSELEEELTADAWAATVDGSDGPEAAGASIAGALSWRDVQPGALALAPALAATAAVPPGYAAVHAPSGWEPADELGSELPDGHLELEHAYGYSAESRGSLLLTASGELIYPVACLCVIASVRGATSIQRFFAGHTSAVCALALHPSGGVVASAQGGAAPYVCVWDARTSQPLATLRGAHRRSVRALAFSADGRLLASVGADAQHTLAVFAWESHTLLARASAGADLVFALAFSPDGGLATAGAMHLRFWSLEAATPPHGGAGARGGPAVHTALVGRSAALHELRAPTALLCVAFTPRGACVTGTAHGELLLWEAGALARSVRAHAGAVHALSLRADGSLVSAGRAPKACFWSAELDTIGSLHVRDALDGLHDEFGRPLGASAASLSVRALASDSTRLFVGTRAGELFELPLQPADGAEGAGGARLIVAGQGRPLRRGLVLGGVPPGAPGAARSVRHALATSPCAPVAATIGADGALRLWALGARRARALRRFASAGTALAFSPDGSALLVGLDDGTVELLDAASLHAPAPAAAERAIAALLADAAAGAAAGAGGRRALRAHCPGGAVLDLKWAPDGSLVAAASAGGGVYILAPAAGLERRHALNGHAGGVSHVDWSEEALVLLRHAELEGGAPLQPGIAGAERWLLRSVSTAAELFFWEVPSARARVAPGADATAGARRVTRPANARDVVWATTTCVLQWATLGTVAPRAFAASAGFGLAQSVDCSREGDTLAAADASGTVSLHRFPACTPGAPTKRYVAHAPGGGSMVRFTHDDNALLSTGGADGALLQWRYTADAGAHVAPGAESAEDEDVATDLAPLAAGAFGAPAASARRRRARAPVGVKRELLLAASGAQAARARAQPFWAAAAGHDESVAPLSRALGVGGGASAGSVASLDGGVELLRRLELETQLRAPGAMDGARPWLALAPPPEHARRAGAAALAPPAEQLRLEFVHGVRAHGAREHLHVSASGELVFPCGSVAVVMAAGEEGADANAAGGARTPPPPSQRFYAQHGAEVLAIAMHPGGVLVATGEVSERAAIHVWSSRSLSTEALLSGGQRDGVGALAFSPDGSLLASADVSAARTIALWNWRAGTLLSLTRGGAGAVLGLAFSPRESSMVSYGQRHVRFWSRPLVGGGGGGGGGWTARKGQFGAVGVQTVLCAAWLPGSGALVTGTSRGMVLEWGSACEVVRSLRLHSQWPIFAIAASAEGIAAGGRGGRLMLWPADGSPADARAARPVELGQLATSLTDEYGRLRCLLSGDAPCVRALAFARGALLIVTRAGELWQLGGSRPHCRLLLQGHAMLRTPAPTLGDGARSELWGLAAHPLVPAIFATAGDDCTVRVWDAERRAMVCMRRVRAPPLALAWAPDASLLAVGCEDGRTLLLEPESLTELPAQIGTPHAGEVASLAFSPDSSLLAVGYADGLIEIHAAFVEGAPEPLRLLGAHAAAVRSLDWSADSQLLQSSCTAMLLAWWDVHNGGERVLDAVQVADVEWATWSSPIGWPVAGILSQLSDGTDVHAVSRSRSGRLLVSADEFGKVNLFSHPTSVEGSACRVGIAHAGHVGGVAWACDDARVYTIGAADTCVMQWRVAHAGRAEHADEGGYDSRRG